ncbi:MAG: dephospho-CoA kinase [Acaryochloridaceae cyanobacterium RU_4_10]|nr:dephospho-CoA kinase [Acaryochloridaceae cyanobacterium RU_4_10]
MSFSTLQRTIGLTGGIATGKTTVSSYLATRSCKVLDADLYAREAVEPGSVGLLAIAQRYGPDLVRADGTLDRPKLGQIIFQDKFEKQWLEAWVHPFVRDRLESARDALSQAPILVMAIPLLFEAQMTDLVSEIWVVTCPEAEQLRRLMERDGLTQSQAQARIDSQWSLAEKRDRADVVIDNGSDLRDLYSQVDAALSRD